MTGAGKNPPFQPPRPVPRAETIAAELRIALTTRDPEHVVLALRMIIRGTIDEAFLADHASLIELENIIAELAGDIAHMLAPSLEPEAVYLGLAAAGGFLRQIATPAGEREPVEITRARSQHIALLADEIDVVVRRRRIEEGGDAFRRFLRINQASRAVQGAAPLH